MSYRDELEAMREREAELRRLIGEAVAAEAGLVSSGEDEQAAEAAEVAIADWRETQEEQLDLRAFRPLTPLQELLAEHAGLVERITDTLDRRLS